MKINLLTITFTLIGCMTFAQTIPVITGETGENKTVTFPQDLKGKYSLLCFASSQKAEPELQGWLDPVYQKFIAKTGIMDDMYDVNVYFVPVLTGTNLAFASSMKKKFIETAQADLKSHVLFCEKDGREIIEKLNMSSKDIPYFFLLDKDGKILYRTSGSFTDEKFDAIDDLIEM